MKVVLFLHLLSLVLGYGAVLLVDWAGLWYVLRHKTKQDLLKLTSMAQPIIWLGLSGLIITGVLLRPNLAKPLTQLKLLLVAIIVMNGVNLHFVQRAMRSETIQTFWQLPKRLIVWSVVSISLSQLAWLGAMVIGFINTSSHLH